MGIIKIIWMVIGEIMDIAKILKDRRVELGISQDELAQYLGFDHRSTVSRLETGKIQWKFDNVVKAAKLLQFSVVLWPLDGEAKTL